MIPVRDLPLFELTEKKKIQTIAGLEKFISLQSVKLVLEIASLFFRSKLFLEQSFALFSKF